MPIEQTMDNGTEKRLWHEAERIAGSWFRRLPDYVEYRDLVGEALLAGLGALETHERDRLPLWRWVRHCMRVRVYEYGRAQAWLRGISAKQWEKRNTQQCEVPLATVGEIGHDGFPGRVASRMMIEQFLSSLPPRDAELVRMRADGYTYREAASQLGMSKVQASTRMHRVRKRAKETHKAL